MPAKAGKKPGSKAKQKTRKQGFYARVLDEVEQLDFELASGVDGIDDEIALLRVKIKSILGDDPKNIRLLVEATNALERLDLSSPAGELTCAPRVGGGGLVEPVGVGPPSLPPPEGLPRKN